MTSIKVKFRPSTVVGKEGSIYYQIIHERKVRQLLTGYKVFPSEWDDKRSVLVAATGTGRARDLLSLRERICRDMERLTRIIRRFDSKRLSYTADEVIDEFGRYVRKYSLFSYMQSVIVMLKQRNKPRTAETYKAARNSFKKFRNDEDIMLDAIDASLMESYEAYLKERGNTPNTISFYMRILRAVYNRAVDDGIMESRNPFRHVYTGVEKTVKRALPFQTMKKIKALDLSGQPQAAYARDIFLFSFYTRGMSFVDMAYLRKSDLKNGILTYRRRKTGQQLSIKWEKDMQEIVDKYIAITIATPFLLPIITVFDIHEARRQYQNKLYTVNFYLKQIAKLIGLELPLTTYVARHSWANIARNKNIPLSVISEGMGHDSETTTQIYLASLEGSVVDNANSLILKDL